MFLRHSVTVSQQVASIVVDRRKPVEVAIIGGGCASIAAAFELTRPEHKGNYHVTIYQLGWRLGGKGASGRGPAARIEEHGFHVWMGFYENAFRLMRECYTELNRDRRKCRIADWRDAFSPAPFIGLAVQSREGAYSSLLSYFPPADGLPGDPITGNDPFGVSSYLVRMANAIRTMLLTVQSGRFGSQRSNAGSTRSPGRARHRDGFAGQPEELAARIARLLKYGFLATTAGLIEAVSLLGLAFTNSSPYPLNLVMSLLDAAASAARRQMETILEK